MFFKKKDKGETPAKAAAPEPRREEPRREEPRRQEARREEPRRQETARQAAPVAPPAPPARAGAGASVDAALVKARGARGAPVSFESVAAQAAAADVLASSSDPADRAAARDLAAGETEKGLGGLFTAAQANPSDAARWRTLGALAFNVDASRSRFAYLSAFNLPARRFWDGIWLARLRGLSSDLSGAVEATDIAGNLATNDAERAVAHTELGLIMSAGKQPDKALKHAEEALALGGAPVSTDMQRQAVVRHMLIGDAALDLNDLPKARKALAAALEFARKLGAAAPKDLALAIGVCEVLEKNTVAAIAAQDNAAAKTAIDEAVSIRRRLASAQSLVELERGLARSLTVKGEVARNSGDTPGANAAFQECLNLVRKISDAHPRDEAAQRELWRTMWHVASVQGAGGHWNQVVAAMEKMQAGGVLDPEGRRFLEEGRRRVPA